MQVILYVVSIVAFADSERRAHHLGWFRVIEGGLFSVVYHRGLFLSLSSRELNIESVGSNEYLLHLSLLDPHPVE